MQKEVAGRHSSYLLGFSKDFKIFKRLYNDNGSNITIQTDTQSSK